MSLSLSDLATKLSDIVEAFPVTKYVPGIWMQRLTGHFGTDPNKLAVVEAEYPLFEHASVQLALDHYLADSSRTFELLATSAGYRQGSLIQLLEPVRAEDYRAEAPVRYVSVSLGRERTLTCVEEGLYLVSQGSRRMAIHMVRHHHDSIIIGVMALQREDAETFLRELKTLVQTLSVYRGQILSFNSSSRIELQFATLDPIPRESLILPDSILSRIERHTIHMAQHRELILSAGLPVKRGILFHGMPGTGKTLTIRYLLGKMSGRTAILLVGRGLASIAQVCNLVRDLLPATIVIEDVDLVAEDRRYNHSNPLLMELLNEMDGLTNDSDILFLLTTNRAQVLEPALKSRPGRIDQAIEIPLPDDTCRRRLFGLYTRGLRLKLDNLETYVERTKGASPAFIRELVRRAALFAAMDGRGLLLNDCHFDEALQELLVTGGELGKSLVGFRSNGNDK